MGQLGGFSLILHIFILFISNTFLLVKKLIPGIGEGFDLFKLIRSVWFKVGIFPAEFIRFSVQKIFRDVELFK